MLMVATAQVHLLLHTYSDIEPNIIFLLDILTLHSSLFSPVSKGSGLSGQDIPSAYRGG